MKTPRRALLLTVALYALLLGAFAVADHFSSRQGANDMGNSMLVFGIGALIISGFFIRSLYQALTVAKSYWLVVGLHLLFAALFVWFFML